MKLGILETGKMTPDLELKYGAYPDMFVRLLGSRGLHLEFDYFSVLDDFFPDTVSQCDAWLITGSRHAAYDELPWIPRLEEFIRSAAAEKIPMVGICFGHQIIAQALGGRVIKSEKGWGLGVNYYKITKPAPWMSGTIDSEIAVNAVHQDQVVEIPEEAELLASSEFCPNAMLAYGDSIFTVQPHPEFDHEFQADLINARRGIAFEDHIADKGIESLSQPIENHTVADWIVDFLRQHERTVIVDQ